MPLAWDAPLYVFALGDVGHVRLIFVIVTVLLPQSFVLWFESPATWTYVVIGLSDTFVILGFVVPHVPVVLVLY